MWPFRKKETEVLTPGKCECGHTRSSHKNGKGRCKGCWAPDEETNYWTTCSCQIYIRRKDDGGGENNVPAPTPAELEKLFQM